MKNINIGPIETEIVAISDYVLVTRPVEGNKVWIETSGPYFVIDSHNMQLLTVHETCDQAIKKQRG